MLGDVLAHGETFDDDERFVDRLAALAQHIELSLKEPSIVGGGGFDELALGLLQRLREPRTLFRRRLLGEIAVFRRECGHAIDDTVDFLDERIGSSPPRFFNSALTRSTSSRNDCESNP